MTVQQQRHDERAPDAARSRAYRLKRYESPAAGIRRIAAGRADDALEQLRLGVERDFAAAVHEARKDLKKLRSVLRLVRGELGDEVYRRECDRFRDAGALLSSARDAEVKLATLRALHERADSRLSVDALAPLIAALEEEREGSATRGGAESAVARAAEEIEAGRAAIDEWPLLADDWSLVEPGMRRQYGRGRKLFGAVRSELSDEGVHEWRKRVKDLWYHLRILRDAKPKRLGRAVDDADRLSELLGHHHDLAVLRDDVTSRRDPLATGDLDRLLGAIAARQEDLATEALALGGRLYAEKPKAFAKRLRSYWRDWR